MIVKDEAKVIERCLQSVRELIAYWVICDTGSSDGTQALIRQALADIPGELHERPWVDFGHNRSELLSLAAGKADYLLALDADWTFSAAPGALTNLTADAYLVRHEHPRGDGFELHSRNLVRGDRRWRYTGVAHEYLDTSAASSERRLVGAVIYNWADGGVGRAARWRQDAQLLERALSDDPQNSRNVFYLAQTYRDLADMYDAPGDRDRAIDLYRRRAAMGGWEEELFYSRFQVGALSARAGRREQAIAALLEAWDGRPQRVEPLYELAWMFRVREQHRAAHMVSERGLRTPVPDDILFVHRWMYDWGLEFEYSIAAYWVGKPRAALQACDRLLANPRLPDAYREQTKSNRAYCLRAIASATGGAVTASRARTR